MAREVEASDDPKDFERAFKKVVSPQGYLQAPQGIALVDCSSSLPLRVTIKLRTRKIASKA